MDIFQFLALFFMLWAISRGISDLKPTGRAYILDARWLESEEEKKES
jgi:hypothetical protein